MDNETPQEAEKKNRIALICLILLGFVGLIVGLIVQSLAMNAIDTLRLKEPASTPTTIHAKQIVASSPEMLKELQ